MRLKVTVLGGEVGEAGMSEIAFRTATNHAFDLALRAAGPVLLEPIMRMEINTPDEHVGDLVSDLQQRRAIIHSTESRGNMTVLHAEAPLANLFGYSSAMRSLSQGRASCSMEPARMRRRRMMCCSGFWANLRSGCEDAMQWSKPKSLSLSASSNIS